MWVVLDEGRLSSGFSLQTHLFVSLCQGDCNRHWRQETGAGQTDGGWHHCEHQGPRSQRSQCTLCVLSKSFHFVLCYLSHVPDASWIHGTIWFCCQWLSYGLYVHEHMLFMKCILFILLLLFSYFSWFVYLNEFSSRKNSLRIYLGHIASVCFFKIFKKKIFLGNLSNFLWKSHA